MRGAHPPRWKFQYRESIHTRQLTPGYVDSHAKKGPPRLDRASILDCWDRDRVVFLFSYCLVLHVASEDRP
jgi:hypothetical protein